MPASAHTERRLVTCVFIDVVGSTELTVRLGPERLKVALDDAFTELRTIIERQGGTVEKYIGDAIYAIFGAPIAHADDPQRAVRAAAGARDRAASWSGADVPLSVRVGVETGEAIIDLAATAETRQRMSVGSVVNVAARLQQHAEPGQVLFGPVAHEAAADLATFRPLGPLALRGLGTVEAWELGALHPVAPRRLPFVGRESELDLLRAAWNRARARSVLVLVLGPPGQGKTRLVEEFFTRTAPRTILQARCRPIGEQDALTPLRDLLADPHSPEEIANAVAAVISDTTERARLGEVLAHSTGVRVSDALSAIDAAAREDEIANAWRRYFRALPSPAVVWIDDLHWADPGVVRVIDRVSRGDGTILVIATARPEFAENAGLRQSGDRFFIELEGLARDEAMTLAAQAGNADERVVRRAEGNPLFIVELARAQAAGSELSVTLHGALGARLDDLPPADREMLGYAAVVGETFTIDDCATLSGRDASGLSRLAELQYLERVEGGFRFHHSLLRDVAYGRLLAAERMQIHARYARARASQADPEVLAHHWWAALGGADAEWVWKDEPGLVAMRGAAFEANLAAGRRQGRLFAVERAALTLERAYVLARDERERGEAKHALADAYAEDLRGDEAWRAYGEARQHFEAAGLVPLRTYLGALKIRLRGGAFAHLPPAAEVSALAARAEAAARATGDPAVLARMLAYLAFKDMDPESSAGDRARLEEAVQLSERCDATTRREILGWYAQDLIRRMELDSARALLDEIDRLPVETSELDRMEHLRGRALLAMRSGDLATLSRLADELVALSRHMGPHLRTHADVYAAQAAVARADWEVVLREASDTDQLLASSPEAAFCDAAGLILMFGAAVNARSGRKDDARALVRRMVSITDKDVVSLRGLAGVFIGEVVEIGPQPPVWALPYLAVAAVAARRHDVALALAERLEDSGRGGARFFAALGEAVREEIGRDSGGPKPAHRSLREIGYVGWSELLSARAG